MADDRRNCGAKDQAPAEQQYELAYFAGKHTWPSMTREESWKRLGEFETTPTRAPSS